MSETTLLPVRPPSPLSRPKAAFNGHTGSPPAIKINGESSSHTDTKSHYTNPGSDRANHSEEDVIGQDPSWEPEEYSMGAKTYIPTDAKHSDNTPPKVNPFHLLSNPGITSPGPPLPAQIKAFATAHRSSLSESTGNTTIQEYPDTGFSNNEDTSPIHITKVTKDSIHVISAQEMRDGQTGGTRRIIQKVTNAFSKSNGEYVETSQIVEGRVVGHTPLNGAPPSPPASMSEGIEPESDDDAPAESLAVDSIEDSEAHSDERRTSIFTSNLTSEPGDLGVSPIKPFAQTPRRSSWNSSSSRTGSLAVVRKAKEREASERERKETKDLPMLPDAPDAQRIELGAALAPPPRISRRTTNPTPPSPTIAKRSPLVHSQSTFPAVPPTMHSQTNVPGVEGAALDSDILAHSEQIRRERLERRQKKASAAENPVEAAAVAPAAPGKPERKGTEDPKVLVGNLIGEDHVNYVLMYNMLTGIRIGVSRCQAKMKRPITDEDFTARHKFSFDIIGNELTPSARYDFKFKDYAPWVFRELRDDHFHLDPADYLLSLTAKYILSELGSPGKSGSFFYFSRDYRFIIKTISHSEHKFLRSILKDYHEHVKTNPHTLLSRFYGLHRVKLPRGRKIHFVIMNNLFPPHRDVHETYDLKGSAFGREYDEEKAKKNPKAVLKDINWVNRGRTLELGPEKRALLSEQLKRDMEFLKRMKVMDYSLLVGIHNMERGNRDNLRENQLSMFHPEIRNRKPTIKGPAHDVRKAVRRSDPKMLDAANQLPQADSSDRRHFLFYQDEGGLRASDEQNQDMDVIYYLGVIDICTPYNTAKKLEHFWKSLTEDRFKISCVDPSYYGQRFLNFLYSVMRNGDLSLRPSGLEAKDCAQRAVGDRGQDTPNAEDTAKASGIASERLNQEKGHHGTPTIGTPRGQPMSSGQSDIEHGLPEDGNVEKRAIVGHLKAE